MFFNVFEADDYEQEAQVKVVVSLTIDDLSRVLKGGEALVSEWFKNRSYDCEFRIIIQGRRTGIGKDQRIIDLRDGGPLIALP